MTDGTARRWMRSPVGSLPGTPHSGREAILGELL